MPTAGEMSDFHPITHCGRLRQMRVCFDEARAYAPLAAVLALAACNVRLPIEEARAGGVKLEQEGGSYMLQKVSSDSVPIKIG